LVDTDRLAPPSDPLPQPGEAADRPMPFDQERGARERAKERVDTERRPWLSPMNQRRLDNFRRNKRGAWSLGIFLVLFVASLFAEFIANDRPLIASYNGELLFPVFSDYPEDKFGGFEATTDYRDPAVAERLGRDLVASALNLSTVAMHSTAVAEMRPVTDKMGDPRTEAPPVLHTKHRRKGDLNFFISANRGVLFAAAIFVAMFTLFVSKHPAGFSAKVINTAANKGTLLALVGMAQTLPILTAGLDLSVGMVFVLTNCLASTMMAGSPLQTAFGALTVLAAGALCGAINGAIVVYGRLQPIIATLATGAIYYGCALWLRPAPGGDINTDFADTMVGSLGGTIPATALLLLSVVLFIWVPYRRSVLGRAAYAIGSSEPAAYMCGIPIARAKFFAYLLAGFLSSIAGLLLTCITYSGEANSILGSSYTLNSIASVVVGGTSLFGGSGGAIGSIFGAFVLRTIGDLLLVLDLDPLWQPLFLGVVLLVAVSLGSFRLLRIKNKLDIYKGG